MAYWQEIYTRWRYLLATCIGQAAGYSISTYLNNLFTPHLLADLHWSRSEFALVGVALFLGILIQPITGRLGDAFGARRVALAGVIGGPLVFVGLSTMTGSLWQFFALNLSYLILCSGATGPVTYSRVIVRNFKRARGLALAIAASTPPAVAALAIPFLSHYIDAKGWRAGYALVAACTAVGGVLAVLLIPADADPPAGSRINRGAATRGPVAYAAILRDRRFQLLITAVFLCMLSFTLQTTQLKVILLDRGIDSATGSLAVSLFAASTIVGRLLCGISLDRFATYAVAAIFLGLPGLGLVILATGVTAPILIAAAVSLLGLSLGAEGDVWAYLVNQYFPADSYGAVLGLVFSAMALSTGLGALLLSLTLQSSGSFTPFLAFSALAIFLGSGTLLWLKPQPLAC